MNKPKSILYINRSKEEAPKVQNELKEEINYSERETLLKVIEALTTYNDALRLQIKILERGWQ